MSHERVPPFDKSDGGKILIFMNNIISIEKKSYAKINLYLKILGRRADNYHDMFTIMHTADIFDVVRVNIAAGEFIPPPQIYISCDDKSVPVDERNTAHKAARAYFKYASGFINIADCEINRVTIDIKKRIPAQAGLGGGSSNAASVLLALNEYFNNLLPEDILLTIAAEIGADVAFFVSMHNGGTAVCEGIGEIVTPLRTKINLRDYKIDIIKPDCNISTKEAFERFDSTNADISCFDRDYIINIFETGTIEDIAEIMHNDFEEVIAPIHSDINEAKAELMSRGAIAAQLSGSGSAVFGIFGR